ncbi:MAG TPA: glycine zipper 2TM domain-containing protein [Azospirillum sp.]|nr:glycine zipper 2TM domain-containing protein [Azospirillum sp.]
MKITRVLAAGMVALSLSACAGPGYDDRYGYYDRGGISGQTAGTVGGAVLGGLVGSRFGGGSGKIATTGIGAVLGGLAGSAIGSSIDRRNAEEERYERQRLSDRNPWFH